MPPPWPLLLQFYFASASTSTAAPSNRNRQNSVKQLKSAQPKLDKQKSSSQQILTKKSCRHVQTHQEVELFLGEKPSVRRQVAVGQHVERRNVLLKSPAILTFEILCSAFASVHS